MGGFVSKNKYRLTKIKRDGKILEKQIKDNVVKFVYENEEELTRQELKVNYIANVQISKRLNNYIVKNPNQGYKIKKQRIDKVIYNMQNEERYINTFYNSIPFSIQYYKNKKKNDIYNKKLELVKSGEYKKEIEKIYDGLITKELLEKEVKSINYLNELIKDNRDEYLKSIENTDDFTKHFTYHLTKKVYKRLINIIREKVVFSKQNKQVISKKVEIIVKETTQLNCQNISEYLHNQFLMNTIDINKNIKEVCSSIDLEKMRQKDIFYKKIAQSITMFNQKLITEYALKHSKENEESLDPLGKNDYLDLKKLEKNDNLSKAKKETLETLKKYWYVTDDEKIKKILNNIVELRSRVIHRKKIKKKI